MKIRVLYFAALADRLGAQCDELDLPEKATVGEAIALLAEQRPQLSEMRPGLATAVNMRYVGPDHALTDGDELALIPPVSGG